MGLEAIRPGNVAVITGAALGIGRAMAQHLVARGMRVALLDVNAEQLHVARDMIGGETDGILCDVAEIESLEHARDRIIDTWGQAPSVLVNNAVTRIGRGMDAPLEEWRRSLDINVMGVVNGVRAFLPSMQATAKPGLVVNVGSKQGITNPPGHPIYNATKAALKSYTETLEHDLRTQPDRRITAHLLIPGWTTTGTSVHKTGAWLPDQVIDFMLEGLAQGNFYILCPDDEVSTERDHRRIAWAADDIIQNRVPLSRWHPEFEEEAKNHC